MSSEVSRASQTHHVPHIGFPQREPVTRAMKVKAAPMGALALAIASATLIRQINPTVAAMAIRT